MTDERKGASLWARALAYALAALVAVIAPMAMIALAVRALRLLAWGLAWLVSLAWGGGVAL